jgi:hypothetical protein
MLSNADVVYGVSTSSGFWLVASREWKLSVGELFASFLSTSVTTCRDRDLLCEC